MTTFTLEEFRVSASERRRKKSQDDGDDDERVPVIAHGWMKTKKYVRKKVKNGLKIILKNNRGKRES